VLDGLVEAVRAGQSRALVLCGEAGSGKTALTAQEALVARLADPAKPPGSECTVNLADALPLPRHHDGANETTSSEELGA
jgi:hypothetical protein